MGKNVYIGVWLLVGEFPTLLNSFMALVLVYNKHASMMGIIRRDFIHYISSWGLCHCVIFYMVPEPNLQQLDSRESRVCPSLHSATA